MVELVYDLFIILVAGLIAGGISKRLGLSMLVGYLLAGSIIGHGGFGLIAEEAEEVEYLARAGALLLLFAIGIAKRYHTVLGMGIRVVKAPADTRPHRRVVRRGAGLFFVGGVIRQTESNT